MRRYKLRTLLIVLAVGPPVLAVCWWHWTVALGLLLSVGAITAGFVTCWWDRGPVGPP
jgi:hypothetical protein